MIAAAGVFAFVLHRQMRQSATLAAQQEAARQQLWATIVEATDRRVTASLAPAATAYDAVLARLAKLQQRLEVVERRAAEEAQRTTAALAGLRQAARPVAPSRERVPATDGRPRLSEKQTRMVNNVYWPLESLAENVNQLLASLDHPDPAELAAPGMERVRHALLLDRDALRTDIAGLGDAAATAFAAIEQALDRIVNTPAPLPGDQLRPLLTALAAAVRALIAHLEGLAVAHESVIGNALGEDR